MTFQFKRFAVRMALVGQFRPWLVCHLIRPVLSGPMASAMKVLLTLRLYPCSPLLLLAATVKLELRVKLQWKLVWFALRSDTGATKSAVQALVFIK